MSDPLQLLVSPFLQMIFDNLTSLIRREFRLLWGVNEELEKLSSILSTIRCVLNDAESKQIKDEVIRDWLRKLKDAAYDADDILDECHFEALQLESDVGDRSCFDQVSGSLSTCFDFNQIVFRRTMGRKIKEVIDKFNGIADERKFHPSVVVLESEVEGFGHGRETSSTLTEPQIYGRGDEKENIVELLVVDNESSQYHLSIYPILGIGGLGKTTLAQLVYNEKRVVKHFDIRIWICVSEDFGINRIIRMIIDHLLGKACDLVDLEPMQNLLQKLLHRKKFLLVLDDVWDNDVEKWNKLKCFLTCGGKGSSVIVTTRLPNVVHSISFRVVRDSCITCHVNPTHNLKHLTEVDCWSLFKQYAFGLEYVENPVLLEIGLKIVSKCGGVPLAVKAIGAFLYLKGEEFWKLVRDSEVWDLQKHGENIVMPALRLSYNHLPSHLRQCFAYCPVYPKDKDIYKEKLIHQWMANGFIQSNARVEVEDLGDEIFDELLWRSFFQDMFENEYGTFCKVHDLMHDLAQYVTMNECSSITFGVIKDVPQKVRHVSVICNSDDSVSTLNTLSKSQPFLRTLYFIRYDNTVGPLDHFLPSIPSFKCLRVLNLSHLWNIKSLPPWIADLKHLRYLDLYNTGISSLPTYICSLKNLQILVLSCNERLKRLPKAIGNLKQLRYLDLSVTDVRGLPESICSLTNLQTLNLSKCAQLKRLPKDLRNMRSLRYLKVDDKLLVGMPVGVGQLARLEMLTSFTVGSFSNRTECAAGIQELERLNRLKGKLRISGMQHVHDPRDAEKANLRTKQNLSDLQLFWSVGPNDEGDIEDNNISKEVLEAFQPHTNLQKLWIKGYPGEVFPSWVWGSTKTLPNLTSLVLHCMPNVEGYVVPPSCLEKLVIAKCPKLRLLSTPAMTLPSSVRDLGVERCNDPTLNSLQTLPHLSNLEIRKFDEQESLPEAPLQNLTCLQTLSIISCNKLRRLPTERENLRTLKSLTVSRCGELESITEEGIRNLVSLEYLEIFDCRSLKYLSFGSTSLPHLPTLQTLVLSACPELDISAVDFGNLFSLRELKMYRLPQLSYFPEEIQRATTLERLYILECKNLKILPEWLRHLPPALHFLHIKKCNLELHKRCEKDKGEDWYKISHLRVVVVSQ